MSEATEKSIEKISFWRALRNISENFPSREQKFETAGRGK